MNDIPFKRSFASCSDTFALSCWCDDNFDSKGNRVTPRDIYSYTKEYYKFHCKKCNHIIEQRPSVITGGSWCAYCTNLKLCKDVNCTWCFDNSLANYKDKKDVELSKIKLNCWCDDNFDKDENKMTPRDITKSNTTKYKFKCYKCNHIFYQSAEGISNGRWCQYCCEPTQLLCDDENCTLCFTHSFASNPLSIYWSSKNNTIPRKVMKSTPTKKYLFNCDSCKNEFEMDTNAISKGRWCPFCKNKTEKILYNKLKEDFPNLQHQLYVDWCRNSDTNAMLPFDFVIEDYKIIIELDGDQHFVEIKKWRLTPEEQIKRDIYKMERAQENGYVVIRITQNEVFNNSYDWHKQLMEAIQHAIEHRSIAYFISKREDIYNKYLLYYYNKYFK
jgi:very-short-patch-repair endonuclease